MTVYGIGDFGNDWVVAEMSCGVPVAFASVDKGWSTILEDSRKFSDASASPVGFSRLDYVGACVSMAHCQKRAMVEVSKGSSKLLSADIDMGDDPEFRRYACL